MSTATKPQLRWSSARSCARKAVFEWEGAPARDRTPQEEGWMWRGKSLGRDYTTFLAAEMGAKVWVDSGHDFWLPPDLRAPDRDAAGLIAETKIEWPLGVGHADIYIVETRTVVEILSSAHASDAMVRSKLLQAVGYTEHHPAAENCALIVVNPSDFTHERHVLVKTSRQYQEFRADMLGRIGQLGRWEKNGELPGRVCAKPGEARGHFCMHAAHCFEGWQPPEPEQVAADETLIAAAAEFETVKRERAAAGAKDRDLERRQKEAQTVLEDADLPSGVDCQVGPYVVRRTDVARKPTFQWAKAEAAGVFEPGLYDAEFWKAGARYSTFKAERTDMTGDEFGEDAPF